MPDTEAPQEASKVLATVPYFADLDAATLETIAQATLRQAFEADQIVFLEGEASTGLYIIQQGWAKAVKFSPAGREQVLRFLGPGETFNAIGVLAGSVNPATVIALEPTTVWIVQQKTLLQLLEKYPGLARIVIQNLARRIHYLIGLVEDLSLRSVEGRLARLLLEQASEGVVHRQRWATQTEMAARLGTVPDVLNRALRSLVEAGLIQVERRVIHILDLQGLAAKAGQDE